MKKIKVLQVNKLYYPFIGGIENLVRDLAEGLNDLPDVEVDVLVCQEKGDYREEIINGVKVYRASTYGVISSLPISIQFLSIFRKISKNYDIIHFHMPFPLGDLALLLSGYKGKVVLWWHSDVIRQKKALIFYKPILHHFLKRADRIIAATPNHIASSSYIKDFESKCSVIPIAINTKPFVEVDDQITSLINKYRSISNGKPIVLFVGRLVYYKGIDVLIRAMVYCDARLVILGDGPLRDMLETLVNDYDLAGKVLFIGKQNNENMIAWYHACDLFVLPSVENSETYGLVQLEAMACGKPVINTDLPTGVPCVSLHNITGYTVPVNDVDALSSAINKLINNPRSLAVFGENAKERIKESFSQESMFRAVLNLYRELLNKAHPI